MKWLEETIKAAILTVCFAVMYVTITDVMTRMESDLVAAPMHQ
jgi:hypothetical protein